MGAWGLGAAVSLPLSLAYRFIVALRIRAPYNSVVCFVNVDYAYIYDVNCVYVIIWLTIVIIELNRNFSSTTLDIISFFNLNISMCLFVNRRCYGNHTLLLLVLSPRIAMCRCNVEHVAIDMCWWFIDMSLLRFISIFDFFFMFLMINVKCQSVRRGQIK